MGEFDDLIEEFVTESREHIADIEEDLIKIETDMLENVDPDVINRVFRAAHSIKGSAKFLDLINIGDLAHKMEDVLNLIRSGKLAPTTEIASVLLRSADMLKSMFEDVESSNSMDISEHLRDLQAILDGEAGPSTRPGPSSKTTPRPGLGDFQTDPAFLLEKLRAGQVFMITLATSQLEGLENLGEVIETRESGSQSTALFATIMEPDMLPLALGVEASDVLQVTESMLAKPAPQPQLKKAAAKPAPVSDKEDQAMPTDAPEKETELNTSFITFSLAEELYAVPIQMIEEIIGRQEISLLPNVPAYIKGVINLRGDLVPIMDLRGKFGLEEIEEGPLTVYLIVRVDQRIIGMVVDSVSDVLVIDPSRLQKTPVFAAAISTDSIHGVYKDAQGQMVILVDLPSLIRPEDWAL